MMRGEVHARREVIVRLCVRGPQGLQYKQNGGRRAEDDQMPLARPGDLTLVANLRRRCRDWSEVATCWGFVNRVYCLCRYTASSQEPELTGEMETVKALFYLPRKDNDGRDLTAEIEDVRVELFVRFVGWTFLGYVKGAWQMDDGSQSIDESEAYVVILVLLDFQAKTTQEAIYLEVHRDVEVRFIGK